MNESNASKAWGNASQIIGKTVQTTLKGVQQEVAARTYRASNELRNAASAPGESPAVRTGIFRLSWGTHTRVEKRGGRFLAIAAIESNVKVGGHLLGDILEHGTKSGGRRMAPRPYKQAVRDRAMPKIRDIYNRPYKV
jgi:hypothetical protein